MAQIIEFPDAEAREWREWEQAIRQSSLVNTLSEQEVSRALPRIREHWEAIFEPITLELPKRAVPGKLAKSQAEAIQGLIDDSAALVVDRLKQERIAAFQRLVQTEMALSQCQSSERTAP